MIAAILPTAWVAPCSSPWLLASIALLASAEIEGLIKPCSPPTTIAK